MIQKISIANYKSIQSLKDFEFPCSTLKKS